MVPKISFWQFPQKLSILEYMLLHDSYMNMAIVNILHYQSSLYDHQGPRNMNIDTLKTHEWAWPIFESSNMEFGHKIFSRLFRTTLRSILCRIIDAILNERVEAKIVWIPNQAKIAFFSNFCFIFNTTNSYLSFVICHW